MANGASWHPGLAVSKRPSGLSGAFDDLQVAVVQGCVFALSASGANRCAVS